MPRRQSSFARALSDAEKRLEKAQAERDAATLRVIDLNEEIPRLRKIIASLSGKDTPNPECSSPVERSPLMPASARGGVDGSIPSLGAIPEDLSKLVGPQDLSSFGSVPPLTEDQTLPDDFEVIPKK